MRKLPTVFALLALLGLAGWGVVVTAPTGAKTTPAAPDNAGEPSGPYCHSSPTGRVCTTY